MTEYRAQVIILKKELAERNAEIEKLKYSTIKSNNSSLLLLQHAIKLGFSIRNNSSLLETLYNFAVILESRVFGSNITVSPDADLQSILLDCHSLLLKFESKFQSEELRKNYHKIKCLFLGLRRLMQEERIVQQICSKLALLFFELELLYSIIYQDAKLNFETSGISTQEVVHLLQYPQNIINLNWKTLSPTKITKETFELSNKPTNSAEVSTETDPINEFLHFPEHPCKAESLQVMRLTQFAKTLQYQLSLK